MFWFGEGGESLESHFRWVRPCTPPPPQHLPNPGSGTPSPAELARVVHVRACLDVALFWVVDGGGSGVRSSQDEDKAVEGDSGGILVVCEDGRTRWSGQAVLASLLSLSQRRSQHQYVTDCPEDRLGGQEQPESRRTGIPAALGLWGYLLPTARPESADSLGIA